VSEGLPDRVLQLRQRWETDPASRVFLQLAEEYRHLGRVHDALGVLEAGLKEHPGYLSALVAKGRCQLELGEAEAARDTLERVVRQDATQMVANKLLVRAYLETGQVDRARERLDLYRLLHEGDPEIEELRGRIRWMEAPRMDSSSVGAAPATKAARSREPGPAAAREDDLFDLAPVPAGRAPAEDDLFDLGYPAPQAAAPQGAALDVATPQGAALDAATSDTAEPIEEPDLEAERAAADIFPGLASRAVRRRYLEALAAEGLFAFGEGPAMPPVGTAPAEPEAFDLGPSAGAAPAWATPPVAEPAIEAPPPGREPSGSTSAGPEPPTLAAAEPAWPAATAPTPPEPAAAPAAPPAVEPATVTLGELYLRQGHFEEAERIFGEVLRREPGNQAARDGLDAVAAHRAPAADSAEIAPVAGAAEPTEIAGAAEPASRRQRTITLLNSYLERLKRGSQRDVS
jgi:tetratricopeptide (TPR) repeat protein